MHHNTSGYITKITFILGLCLCFILPSLLRFRRSVFDLLNEGRFQICKLRGKKARISLKLSVNKEGEEYGRNILLEYTNTITCYMRIETLVALYIVKLNSLT